jgi:hypothetical protein
MMRRLVRPRFVRERLGFASVVDQPERETQRRGKENVHEAGAQSILS